MLLKEIHPKTNTLKKLIRKISALFITIGKSLSNKYQLSFEVNLISSKNLLSKTSAKLNHSAYRNLVNR
jgi:hypothetical protein